MKATSCRVGALLLPLLFGGLSATASQAATLTVTNTNLSGPGSLRDALATASADNAGDVITFDSNFFNAANPRNIIVGNAPLTISGSLTVQGPGAKVLTIGGGLPNQPQDPNARAFSITSGTSSLSGLTLSNGADDILNQGTLTVTDCALAGSGFGIYSTGNATLVRCSVSGCQRGAVYNFGTMSLTNCTIANNAGGSINNSVGSTGSVPTLSLTNCTIANNTAGSSRSPIPDGIDNSGTVTLTSSILAGPYVGSSKVISGDSNLFYFPQPNGDPQNLHYSSDGASLGFTGPHDLNGVDPRLAGLGPNGGPTWTESLFAGSPAIDADYNGLTTTDQRGVARPQGARSDIGAFEVLVTIAVGQYPDLSIDQRYVDCYNRTGPALIGAPTGYVYTIQVSHSFGDMDGSEQDFIDGTGAPNSIVTGGYTSNGLYLAFDVRGAILSKHGAEPGILGFPTSDQFACTPSRYGATGVQQYFGASAIYSGSGTVGTHAVLGATYQVYAAGGKPWSGGTGGILGFPTSDETAVNSAISGASGTVLTLEGGAIYQASSYISSIGQSTYLEARPVYGDIYRQYLATGAHNGTHGYPTSDPYPWMGGTRQNFESGFLASLPTHLLLNNADGRVGIGTVDGEGKYSVLGSYGPYTDGPNGNLWKAVSLATGPDGVVRLLWNNPDGKALLWNITPDGNFTVVSYYGPYVDGAPANLWRAATVTVGPDNVPHILWTNTDGKAILWNVNADGTFQIVAGYGPYTDGSPSSLWHATSLSTGPDGINHLLWNNPDGHVALWTLNSQGGFTPFFYGPYADGPGTANWAATSLAVGPDNVPHILWTNPDGKALFWNVAADGSFAIAGVYGPYADGPGTANWAATALAVGADNEPHILWDNPDGRIILWNVYADGTFALPGVFNPGAGWSGTTISAP